MECNVNVTRSRSPGLSPDEDAAALSSYGTVTNCLPEHFRGHLRQEENHHPTSVHRLRFLARRKRAVTTATDFDGLIKMAPR